MKTCFNLYCIMLVLLLQGMLTPQEISKVIILSDRVGQSVERTERDYFHLFERYSDFKKAVIYISPARKYFVRVTTGKPGTQEKDTTILYSETTILRIAEKIDHFEDIVKGTYHIGDSPVHLSTADGNNIELKSGLPDDSKNEPLLSDTFPKAITVSDTTAIYKIVLNDDSELIGIIINQSNKSVCFQTIAGLKMDIDKSLIKELNLARGAIANGKFMREDPNQTRLLFAPTATTLEAGEGYFSIYEVFFPFLSIGVTDFITLSGGMTLFPGAEEQIIYFAPKVRALHFDNFELSGGVLFAHVENEDFGITYGVTTYGSNLAGISVGLGWGFADNETAEKPIIMIGGEVQLSNNVKLLSENWIPPESDGALLSFGIRFFGEHLAADFALITSTEANDGFPFIPWIGFAYNF